MITRAGVGRRILCERCSAVKERQRSALCDKCLEEADPDHAHQHRMPEPTRPCPAKCEMCGRAENGRYHGHGKRLKLSRDHCHETGVFRGWLCRKCNLGLGKLGDTLAALYRAVDYLEQAYGVKDD